MNTAIMQLFDVALAVVERHSRFIETTYEGDLRIVLSTRRPFALHPQFTLQLLNTANRERAFTCYRTFRGTSWIGYEPSLSL